MAEASALSHQIEEAVEPVSQFWPMKGFVSHNPLQGLEHLPFDEAVREAKHLFGAEGYLPVEEYRGLCETGRITERSVDRALARLGPQNGAAVSLEQRTVSAAEVHRIHLLHGIDGLAPALFEAHFANEEALLRPRDGATAEVDLGELWRQVLSALDLVDPHLAAHDEATDEGDTASIELPYRRALSDWIDELTGSSIVATIDAQAIKWVSSFVDEGMAGWEMPSKRGGFYATWRELAQHDASGRLLGIDRFAAKVAELPSDPEQAVQRSLEKLEVPAARWPDYLTRVFAQLPGWTGLIRWRGLNPEDPIQRACPIDIVQYLAVRLFYEAELVGVEARRQWDVAGTLPAVTESLEARGHAGSATVGANKLAVCRDAWRVFHLTQFLGLSADSVRAMTKEHATAFLGWLDEFPAERQSPVWLEAYEDSYRDALLSKIAAHRGTVPESDARPLAQAAFCIDVRSEPFRRHFEARRETSRPFGYAGFFGIPMSHRRFDADESFPFCPVLLTPANEVLELPRSEQQEALESYASGSRWKQLGEHLFHDLKHDPVASFLLVDVSGAVLQRRAVGQDAGTTAVRCAGAGDAPMVPSPRRDRGRSRHGCR